MGDVNTVIDVTEIFDARDNRLLRPTWRMELRPLQYFANTEGGHIEASSQYTTPYVPLSTSGFHGLLDDSVSNLQTLADAVDGLAIGGSGTAGRVAQFDSARVLEASNLVGPAANVLTLEATGVYTLTVPATGTAALLGTNQTFTGFNYFSKGLFASGYTAPTGFVGVEILYLNGVGYIDAYDYVNSVELPLSIDGSSVAINGVAFTGTVGGLINLEISNGRELTLVCTNDLSLTIAATASISGTNTGDNAVNSRYDIGSDTQAWSAKLDTIAALANAAGVLTNNGAGVLSWGAGGGDISGTGIAGQVAEFVTDTKTIQAANLIAPANLLTLVAAAPYSLTVPNTGTVAMLGITNAFTSTNTFTATTENLINGTATLTATSGSRDGFIFTTNVSPTIDGTGNYRNVEYIIQSGNTKEISTMINFQAYQNINSYAVGLSGFVIQTAYGASANVVYHKEFSIQQDTKAVGAAVANKYALYIDDITHGNNNWSIYTNAGNVVFNAGGDASTDFTIRSDNYDAVVVDGSEDSIVLMSNAAGKVGFFGAAAVVRQTGPFSQETGYIAGQLDSEAEIIAAFNTTNEGINTIRTALINYGLITDE